MSVMAKPRKDVTPEQKRPARSGSPVNVYVDDEIREAIDLYIDDYNEKFPHPASLRSTVEAALKAFLKEAGFYPPRKR